MKINDKTLQALVNSIKFREMRSELISSNIANAETPGYKAKRLAFEEALQRALDVDGNNSLKTVNGKHFDVGGGGFDNLEPRIHEDPNGVMSEDGNTVDRTREQVLSAQNEVMYNASIQLLNKKLSLMKYAISAEQR